MSGYGGEALARDVSDPDSGAAAVRAVDGRPIDLLINNAGIAGSKGYDFGGIDFAAWDHVLQVNTLGPLRVAEAFVDAVARSERKVMVFVSSIMGSIAENEAGRHRSEEHTSELQSLMRISYAVFCLKKNIVLVSLSSMQNISDRTYIV